MTAPALPEDSVALRRQLIAAGRAMIAAGLGVNAEGNLSVRCVRGRVAGFLITPTGLAYASLQADDLAFMRLTDGGVQGRRAPSSEWRMHRDLYAARAEFGAIVHTHAPHATALACHGRGIPPFHYMVAAAGGSEIRCAPYATFGTQALSDHALDALRDRRACLLAHHGAIACANTVDAALALMHEVEHLARTYLAALALGEPPPLPADEMARVLARFADYGQPPPADASPPGSDR